MTIPTFGGMPPERQAGAGAAAWKGMSLYAIAFVVLGLLAAAALFYEVSAITRAAPPASVSEYGKIDIRVDAIRQGRRSLRISGGIRVRGKDMPLCRVVLSDGKTAYSLPTKLVHLERNLETVATDEAYSTLLGFQSLAFKPLLPKGTYAVFLRYRDIYTEKFFATGHSVSL